MEYQMSPPPVYTGGYRIGGPGQYFQVQLTKKPMWFHRKMMKWCFGWEWVDASF